MTLIETSYVLLFILAVVSLYSIIASGKHRVLTFLLVPLVIAASISSFYAFYSLQGKAIKSWPEGEIEIISLQLTQPHISMLVVHKNELEPTFYSLEWSPEIAKKLQEILTRQKMGMSTTGEFKKPEAKPSANGNSSADGPRFWEPKKYTQIQKEE